MITKTCLGHSARVFRLRTIHQTSGRRWLSKVYPSVAEAVQVVKSGDTILAGGFGLCGVPNTLINALSQRDDVRDLTAVSNNAGAGNREGGLTALLSSGQLSKVIMSYIGT